MGLIRRIQRGANSLHIAVSAQIVLNGLKPGDSVAVNGACLTVTEVSSSAFTADVMHETMRRTTLADLRQGAAVNLERAMPADGRFGGHMVLGHVDGIGVIQNIARDDIAKLFIIRADESITRYIVEKGSVALEGVSLTVTAVKKNSFCVSVIPHTIRLTTLSSKKIGDRLNVEIDIICKYVERLLGEQSAEKFVLIQSPRNVVAPEL